MNILDLSPNQLKRAAAIKEQIDRLNKELRGILGASTNSHGGQKKNRAMSASVKKKIAAAQKARWANLRRSNLAPRPASVKTSSSAKSAATRAKLSAKMKAYWAAKKGAKSSAGKTKNGKAQRLLG